MTATSVAHGIRSFDGITIKEATEYLNKRNDVAVNDFIFSGDLVICSFKAKFDDGSGLFCSGENKGEDTIISIVMAS